MDSQTTVVDVWDCDGQIAENVAIERKDGVKAWVTVMYGCNNFAPIVLFLRTRQGKKQING